MKAAKLALALVIAACCSGTSQAQGVGPCGLDAIEVVGRVLEPLVLPGAPVPCCDVEATIVGTLDPTPRTGQGRTRADGTFSICVPCISTNPDTYTVTVTALCCNGTSAPQTFVGCDDPATGRPRRVDVGDVVCADPPVTNRTSLTGFVGCRPGTLLDPVADCGILVEQPNTLASYFTRTDASGRWEVCVDCLPPPSIDYVDVTSQCCDQTQRVMLDLCPSSVEVPSFVCDPCPVPPCPAARDVEFSGRVVCGTPPVPVAGCPVTVVTRSDFDNNGDTLVDACATSVVTTDSDGRYVACLPCPSDGCNDATWSVDATAECCGAATGAQVSGCAPRVGLTDIVCPTCPGTGCGTNETVIQGTVTCSDPAGGTSPMENCEILISPLGCMAAPFSVFTNVDGSYTACIDCIDCTSAVVSALCCGQQRTTSLACGQAATVDFDCGTCGGTNPCGAEQQVFGRVTCLDPVSGQRQGVAGCTVNARCGSPPGYTAVTDANGFYSICTPCGFPCSGDISVFAECCGASTLVLAQPGCPPLQADIDCGDCGPPRACPGPRAVLAAGSLACEQNGVSLAGCPVVLTPIDASGNPGTPSTAIVEGDGSYQACVECPPSGLSSIDALATCCGATASTPTTGCPETATLEPMTCATCSPCPDGMTRVQGRVRCRGGGPVADCPVRITVEGCGAVQVHEATTDREGKYRLCIPCPCRGAIVRVTSLCCDATRAVVSDQCDPVTPIPTLFCPVPCR